MSRGHARFPNDAFLQFAVAQHGVHVAGVAGVLRAQRHADRNGRALTQRAGGSVHAGALFLVGVALQNIVQLPEALKLLLVEEALFAQHGVQRRGGVALGQHQTVAGRVVRVLGIHLHQIIIQGDQNLRGGQGAAGMARTGSGGHGDNVPPYLLTDRFHFRNVHDNLSSIAILQGP